MDRSDYRAKAIKYFALANTDQDPLMAAQLKSGVAAIVLLVFLFGPTSTNLLSKSLRMSAIGNPSIPGFMLCLFACHGRQLRV